MPTIVFTSNLQRHVSCPKARVAGRTVREALEQLFADHPHLRAYILDDQAALRKHMAVFLDGEMIRDRNSLSDPLQETSTVYVLQALSGG